MRMALCPSIENNTRILAGLNQHALSCVTTPRREMKYPKLDRKHMTMPVFLVHCLGHNLWVIFKRGLIALSNN